MANLWEVIYEPYDINNGSYTTERYEIYDNYFAAYCGAANYYYYLIKYKCIQGREDKIEEMARIIFGLGEVYFNNKYLFIKEIDPTKDAIAGDIFYNYFNKIDMQIRKNNLKSFQ